jgi:hypothetical protein
MKWTEITLRGVQPLQFGGKRVGTVERRETADRIDGLAVHFDAGPHVELQAAVDVSEQLKYPRVVVIEGAPRDAFLLFGGEKTYRLTIDGAVKCEFPLYRRWGYEEYWTMRILDHGSGVVVIYEAGVMAIDEELQVRWHKPKLFNDEFVALEDNILMFARDDDEKWFIRLEDGGTPQ